MLERTYNLVWSSFGESNMDNIPNCIPEEAVVLVINARHPVVEIILASPNYNDEDVVQSVLDELTSGCNYRYHIIKRIGNTFFCN